MFLISASQVGAKNVKIEVITDEYNCPSAVEPDDPCWADSEDVCVDGNQPNSITWKYKGSNGSKPDFQIVMKDPGDHDIFSEGCHQSAKSIHCKISEVANPGSYSYSVVNADGCEHDPKIIINN